MAVTFDGAQRLIIATSGTILLDVADVYSRWKDWVAQSDNAKYAQAFRVVGGDPTFGSNVVTPYFFLLNGWRIRPQEASHTLNIDGIVLVDGGGDPIVNTLGTFQVRVQFTVPVRAETIEVNSSGPDLSDLETKIDQVLAKVNLIADVETGSWEIVGTQLIFKRPDTTEICRFNLFNAEGAASSTNPTRRVRV